MASNPRNLTISGVFLAFPRFFATMRFADTECRKKDIISKKRLRTGFEQLSPAAKAQYPFLRAESAVFRAAKAFCSDFCSFFVFLYEVYLIAESLELFEYAPGVRDTNNLGAWWLENKMDCSLPYEIDEFFDYAGYGESIVENNDGEFVKVLGFVCMEEGYTLEDVLQDTDQGMGGM